VRVQKLSVTHGLAHETDKLAYTLTDLEVLILGNEKMHFHGCLMATSDSVKQHKLRKLIARLSDKLGKGKEFISLYIPEVTSINETVRILKEKSDSTKAKSGRSEERAQKALKIVIQHLKLQKEVSKNGFAIFAGTFVTDDLGGEEFNIQELAPPEPITAFLYGVEDHFMLEPLREMVRGQKVVGLLELDSKEASFGVYKGECLELIENITSGIPGKSGKGGSSQRRYERERDSSVTNFFHRVAKHATKAFLEKNKITVLIAGGPGLTKEDFLKDDFLHYELQNMLLSTVDTQSAGNAALREMLDKSTEALKSMCSPEEKRVMQRLLAHMGQQDGLAVAGLDLVLDALNNGKAEVALVTDNAELIDVVVMCKRCGLSKAEIVDKAKKVQTARDLISSPCEKCGAVEYEVEEKDIVDILEDLASQTNATVEVISSESEEKAKLTAFGGCAAILRY
jgi:peptide chain release factor subunit 1